MRMETLKNGFLGTDQGVRFEVDYKKAKAVIIPFGMEAHVSYGAGTKNGPKAILKASHELNENDEQTLEAPYKCGFATLKEPKIPKDSVKAILLLKKITGQILKDKKFPIILGGEHTLSFGSLGAVCKNFSDISILHFDAHADLRKKYRGSAHSHASALRQIIENLPIKRLVSVGIRTVSEIDDELGFILREKKRLKIFWGWEKLSAKKIVAALPNKNVYITFDVDAFDPSIMPSTGTPEPGGLDWWQTVEILKLAFKEKNVVGFDVVEHSPIKNFHGPDFLVALLIYKMIGYKFFGTKTKAK